MLILSLASVMGIKMSLREMANHLYENELPV